MTYILHTQKQQWKQQKKHNKILVQLSEGLRGVVAVE